jgi:SRSO17 transposase
VGFATKGELAKRMLGRAFEAGVPASWVVADTVYGTARDLKGWLEWQRCSYVLAVPETKGIYYGGHQRQAKTVARELPEEAWLHVSAGEGSKGERLYDWACVPLANTNADGAEKEFQPGRWLLVSLQIEDPREFAYYLCYGASQTEERQLIRIAGKRWSIEDGFKAAKGQTGSNEYEVRKWEGWHRHITLSLFAHAYLVVLRSATETTEDSSKGGSGSIMGDREVVAV